MKIYDAPNARVEYTKEQRVARKDENGAVVAKMFKNGTKHPIMSMELENVLSLERL